MQANRAQIVKWLSQHVIDPNDPRNAALVELLKTHEAGAAGLLGDLFRLDIFPDVAMKVRAEERASPLTSRFCSATITCTSWLKSVAGSLSLEGLVYSVDKGRMPYRCC